jgi:hypothetical protein
VLTIFFVLHQSVLLSVDGMKLYLCDKNEARSEFGDALSVSRDVTTGWGLLEGKNHQQRVCSENESRSILLMYIQKLPLNAVCSIQQWHKRYEDELLLLCRELFCAFSSVPFMACNYSLERSICYIQTEIFLSYSSMYNVLYSLVYIGFKTSYN